MNELSDFLLKCIAEDEEAAREATPGPWTAYGDGVVLGTSENPEVCSQVKTWNMWHLSLHDPKRVLTECETKRWIIEINSTPATHDDGLWGESARATLKLLALTYAGYPGWKKEWELHGGER